MLIEGKRGKEGSSRSRCLIEVRQGPSLYVKFGRSDLRGVPWVSLGQAGAASGPFGCLPPVSGAGLDKALADTSPSLRPWRGGPKEKKKPTPMANGRVTGMGGGG